MTPDAGRSSPSDVDTSKRANTWHWSRRLGFMFVFVWVLLIALPFPFGLLGVPSPIGSWWEAFWTPIVPWAARHVFHIRYAFPRYGGGENTWDYVQFGTATATALIVALVWCVFDRGRTDLRRLDQWLRVYLRLFLAAALFAYGWTKVFPVQFPALGPERLSETFGEASPNGFMWAFMGYSTAYMAFAGVGEVVAGALLCFRRTTTLGALIGIAVMTNVVAMNFAFDVGVKLGSMSYLLGLVYLAAPGAGRLVNLLVLDRPTEPLPPPLWSSRWERRLTAIVPGVLAAYVFAANARGAWRSSHEWGQLAAQPPLYGLYDVETATRNGVVRSLVPEDSTLWARVAIGQQRSTIRLTSGELGFYVAAVDTAKRTVRFASRDEAHAQYTLSYDRPDSARLVLRGRIGEDSVELSLRQRDETQYRLVSHPFHWVQNTTENR